MVLDGQVSQDNPNYVYYLAFLVVAALDLAHEDDVIAFFVLAAVEALEGGHHAFQDGRAVWARAHRHAIEAVDVAA